MDIKRAFTAELQHEAASTRKMLSRVPFDNTDWKPHAKSATVMGIARHVARLPTWVTYILSHDEIDVTKSPFPPYPEVKTPEDLTSYFDDNVNEAVKLIDETKDEDFMQPFTMRAGDKVMFTLPKAAAIRNMSLNHLVHHRGQLSVYLRLLDIPVPGMYGPSADEGRPA